jgi:hypothetical protein
MHRNAGREAQAITEVDGTRQLRGDLAITAGTQSNRINACLLGPPVDHDSTR